MTVPRWFPEFAFCIEIHPLICIDTKIMYHARYMMTYEIASAHVLIFNRYKFQFRIYQKECR